jgi:SAM-dependent methyltransferase
MPDQRDDHRRDRRGLFGGDAASYERGRPGYPVGVFDLLREFGGLGPGCRVLEIGAGSGQATRHLLEAEATVLAVEFSADLAALLASKHRTPRLEVRVGAFEDLQLEPESADLVVAATAFHWVPTELGLQKCAEVLREGGALALWWNVYGDPSRPDPFREALEPVLAAVEPALLDVPSAGNSFSKEPPYGLDTAARISEFAATGDFGPVRHELIEWTGRHRPDELRAMFATFSPWLALPEERRRVALDAVEQLARERFGGTVERPYLTPVYLARKHRTARSG